MPQGTYCTAAEIGHLKVIRLIKGQSRPYISEILNPKPICELKIIH